MPHSIEIPDYWTIEEIKKMASEENPIAQRALGLHFDKNNEPEEAIAWYLKASQNQDPIASCNLGRIEQLRGNLEKAEQLFRRARSQERVCGDNELIAMNMALHHMMLLAQDYFNQALEKVVCSDDNAACLNFEKALELGIPKAGINLATLYSQKEDFGLARTSLERALYHTHNPLVESPDEERSIIHQRLATLHAFGQGCEKDVALAHRHLKLAIAYDNNNQKAHQCLNELLADIFISLLAPIRLNLFTPSGALLAQEPLPEVPEEYRVLPEPEPVERKMRAPQNQQGFFSQRAESPDSAPPSPHPAP